MRVLLVVIFVAIWAVSEGKPGQKCIDEIKKIAKPAFAYIKNEVCQKEKCKIPYVPARDFFIKHFSVPVSNDIKAILTKCGHKLPKELTMVNQDIVKKCLDPELSKLKDLCKATEDAIGNVKGCVMGQLMALMPILPNADVYCECLLKSNYIKDIGTAKKHSFKKLISTFVRNKSLCKK